MSLLSISIRIQCWAVAALARCCLALESVFIVLGALGALWLALQLMLSALEGRWVVVWQ